MRAILLAAGYGTRLRPITNEIPKCLVQINEKVLLDLWINKLVNIGIEKIIINTHYLSHMVEDYISSHKHRDKIEIAYEKEIKGTAGTLINNIDFYNGEEGLLIHADNFCVDDLENYIEAHKQRPDECEVTMLTFRSTNPSDCGIVKIDLKNIVREFFEKKEPIYGNLANGAIYLISKKGLWEIKKEYHSSIDFSGEILPKFLGRIHCYETKEFYIDIGTIENLNKAREYRG